MRIMLLEYEELVNNLEKSLPKKYKQGIVHLKYYERPFYNAELNFDPYKKHGQILPTQYVYRDAINPETIYNMSKGEQYIPQMLYWISYNKDYNCFPYFFIYAFFTDLLNCFTGDKTEQVKGYISKAIADLRENDYTTVDFRCKRMLPVYDITHFQISKMVNDVILEDVNTLTKTIYHVFDLLLNPYQLEYWCFQDSEYKRANSIYKNAVLGFQKNVLDEIRQL